MPSVLAAAWRVRPLRELAVASAFCLFTALLTWPYVTRLRDAVVDPGDPYLVTWIMWWDYHQTFRDPLNLFHANTFYPLKYTLAFSEHCYGLALPFFPLFALGLRPLTVHAVAMFLGFALSGYGAYRLARTLTGSEPAAWVAGVAFAFVPYRFHLMSQLVYLFTPWLPLVFEALVLFVRRRGRKRAAWLGFAFFMTGLTSVSFFAFALVPLGLCGAVLLTRHGLWRDREFWRRGAAALGLAALALVPFMLPYYVVSKLYGFKRSIEEVKANSAWPRHWLSAENRNKLWFGMGESMEGGARFKLFPGLLMLLFSLAALLLVEPSKRRFAEVGVGTAGGVRRAGGALTGWLSGRLARLDAFILFAFAASLLAVGFDRTGYFGGVFGYVTSERALAVLTLAVAARVWVAYPARFRAADANFFETLTSPRRCDAFWVGLVLAAVGFLYTLGWNFFFYRICYDLFPVFRNMRVPARGSMFAYLGLALLAGLGVRRLAEVVAARRPRVSARTVCVVACALLLAELNGAPLAFMRGEVYPDAVTLRLKGTEMRGGVVILPAGPDYNHRYMLRSADHARPLIFGTSGFNSPQEDQIERWTAGGPSRPASSTCWKRYRPPTSFSGTTSSSRSGGRTTRPSSRAPSPRAASASSTASTIVTTSTPSSRPSPTRTPKPRRPPSLSCATGARCSTKTRSTSSAGTRTGAAPSTACTWSRGGGCRVTPSSCRTRARSAAGSSRPPRWRSATLKAASARSRASGSGAQTSARRTARSTTRATSNASTRTRGWRPRRPSATRWPPRSPTRRRRARARSSRWPRTRGSKG
ncbi:MAG TPA: hypothetical protein VF621_20130, partial [Pyrinomonadaceae bacterium]